MKNLCFILGVAAQLFPTPRLHAQHLVSGDWTYTLNPSNEATIISYSGTAGEVVFPETLEGNPVVQVGGSSMPSPGIPSYGQPVFGWMANPNITSITLPEGVTTIGQYAFGQLNNLTNVTLPASLRIIGDSAFANCVALRSVAIPEGVTDIGWSAFSSTGLTNMVIPDSVTTLGNGAFSGCGSLVSVALGSGLKFLEAWAWNGCTNLGSVSFSPTAFIVPTNACSGLTALTNVSIPAGVTMIGDYAFGGCSNLTEIVIPTSVASIGPGAFGGSGLVAVSIPSGVTSIGDYAFGGCSNLTEIIIPNSVTNIGSYAFSFSALTNAVIGDGVRSVGGAAFDRCRALANVAFGTNVTSIGPEAFFETQLTNLVLPSSVVSVGSDCFFGAPIRAANIPPHLAVLAGSMGLPGPLATSLLFDALVETGLATTNQFETVASNTVIKVQSAPNDYNLYSSTQYEANRITGAAEGKAEVTSNPTAYNLFTESSIMDMNLGSLMLKKGSHGNELDLELTIETKDSLLDNEWQVAERIARKVSMDGAQRQFLRVRADAPYVAPNVKVLAHPTLGNILTDGGGRALYFFTPDSPGANPMFSGYSWPYVPVPASPKADAGVSAILGSSSFGRTNGSFLTINTRPAYTYVGDTTAGQADGHGAGWVWYTIKADGTINQ